MASVRWVAWGAVVLLVGACGQSGDPRASSGSSDAPAPSATAALPGTICQGDGMSFSGGIPAREPLPDSFIPTTVIVCSLAPDHPDETAVWEILTESQSTSGIEGFVAQLRRPSVKRHWWQSVSCTAQLDLDPEVWLRDAAGKVVRPGWPRDVCDHLMPEAMTALQALTLTKVSEVKLRQIGNPAAIAAKCPGVAKYSFDLDGSQPARAGTFVGATAAVEVRACLMRRMFDPPPGGDGEFVSGRVLSASTSKQLLTRLQAAPTATPCTEKATQFVVLQSAEGFWAEIELDGCHRIATEDGGQRQAPAEVLALLT